MKSRQIDQSLKIFILVFKTGDELAKELLDHTMEILATHSFQAGNASQPGGQNDMSDHRAIEELETELARDERKVSRNRTDRRTTTAEYSPRWISYSERIRCTSRD
jgi:hypothetical protein